MSQGALFEPEARGVDPYDHQLAAANELRENIRRGIIATRGSEESLRGFAQVLSAPTGSGKTEIAIYLIQECLRKGRRALFCADRLTLIGQTSRRLDLYGIPHGVIQGQHERRDDDAPVQVASIQTLARRRWPDTDLLIVDECHTIHKTVTAHLDELRRIHEFDPSRSTKVIGLTATPFTKGLGRHYGAVVSVTTTYRLIEQGFLAPFRVFNASQPDMTGAKVTKTGEWVPREAERRALPIIGDLVAEYLKWCAGQKFIAFGATIKHCEEIQRRFMDVGVRTALYTADENDLQRAEAHAEFDDPNGYVQGLVSVAALAKGYDSQRVQCIIIARPLRKSLAEHIQIIGRGLRADPANPSKVCTILDHAGNVERLWPDTEYFFRHGASELDNGRKKEKKAPTAKEALPMKCPECKAVHAPRPNCPSCGFEYPRKANVLQLPGELREWTGADATAAPVDVLRTLAAQLTFVANEKGYKQGWVFHKFRELTGGQVLPYVGAPEPPTDQLLNRLRYLAIRFAKGQQKRKGRQ